MKKILFVSLFFEGAFLFVFKNNSYAEMIPTTSVTNFLSPTITISPTPTPTNTIAPTRTQTITITPSKTPTGIQGGVGAGPIVTSATDLKIMLNKIGTEHVALTEDALRSVFDQRPDVNSALKAVDNNSVEMANSLGSVYGSDFQNRFLTLWRNHIIFLSDYTNALRSNDTVAQNNALSNLSGTADNISSLFGSANPNINRSQLRQLISTHEGLLKQSIDSYAAGNFDDAYSKEQDAFDQSAQISNIVAAAVIKQFPNKFK